MADFKELIDSIRKEQVTLFLGSGFSRKAGAPMANAIVESLKESMPNDITIFRPICIFDQCVIVRCDYMTNMRYFR